jgi:hypothetical protein
MHARSKVPHDHARYGSDRNSNHANGQPPTAHMHLHVLSAGELKGTPTSFSFSFRAASICVQHACARLHLHPTAALDLDLLSCSPLRGRLLPPHPLFDETGESCMHGILRSMYIIVLGDAFKFNCWRFFVHRLASLSWQRTTSSVSSIMFTCVVVADIDGSFTDGCIDSKAFARQTKKCMQLAWLACT